MFLLLAEIDAFAAAATVVVGSFVAMSVWWVVAALTTNDLEQDDEWRYDVSRINALRRLDPIYRMFQPLLQVFAKLNRAAFSGSLDEVYREIQAAGLPRFWLPEEYLARCELLALADGSRLFLRLHHFYGHRWMRYRGDVDSHYRMAPATAIVKAGTTTARGH